MVQTLRANKQNLFSYMAQNPLAKQVEHGPYMAQTLRTKQREHGVIHGTNFESKAKRT
jgi:hypothetical protein